MSTTTERRTAWTLILGICASLAVLWFFAWLAEEVLEGDTAAFDLRVRMLVHAQASGPLTAVMRFFTVVGAPLSLLALGAVALWLLWVYASRRAVMLFLVTLVGAGVLDGALKYGFGRPPPAVLVFLHADSLYPQLSQRPRAVLGVPLPGAGGDRGGARRVAPGAGDHLGGGARNRGHDWLVPHLPWGALSERRDRGLCRRRGVDSRSGVRGPAALAQAEGTRRP